MSAADATPAASQPEAVPHPARALDLDHIDYSPFDTALPAAEVKAFRDRAVAAGQANAARQQLTTTPNRPMMIGLLVVFGLVFIATLVQLYIAVVSRGNVTPFTIGIPIFFAFLTLASALQVYKEFGDKHWGNRARLPHFAVANGLEFRGLSAGPAYPGVIFRRGDSRTSIDRLTSTTGRYFDLGNFEYWTRTRTSRSVARWGYLALRLDRKLPNMLLIAKKNQGLGGSDLPGTFHPDQVLSLEGDFDKYFTLYCPKQYEADALYVFTPDLMALLIDEAYAFDVEIVDDWMFVVVRKPFSPFAATYERLFTIVRTVGAKTLSQTKNYHDARAGAAGANTVASEGRRLRRNISAVRVLIMAVVLAIMLAIPIGLLILRQLYPD
ncbi:MAG TPA: hypothetical protein VHZ81_04500 [Galbitalea sp.]|jgi:hypothetical protein|nr:hypothetical protein [Galbitalea sp.]